MRQSRERRRVVDTSVRVWVRRATIGRVLNLLAESAEVVASGPHSGLSPDPDDEPFCACAEDGDADFIVTLNPSDFPEGRLSAKVIVGAVHSEARASTV